MKKHLYEILQSNDTVKKRLAKMMALRCFRGTIVQDLRDGEVPRSLTGDYSDVKVVCPSREIPWNDLSRLSDAEMERLMKNVTDQCYEFLLRLFNGPDGDHMMEELVTGVDLSMWGGSMQLRRNFNSVWVP